MSYLNLIYFRQILEWLKTVSDSSSLAELINIGKSYEKRNVDLIKVKANSVYIQTTLEIEKKVWSSCVIVHFWHELYCSVFSLCVGDWREANVVLSVGQRSVGRSLTLAYVDFHLMISSDAAEY